MYISTSDKAGYNNIITVFGDFRRFSAIFGDFRRFSAIFGDFRQLSAEKMASFFKKQCCDPILAKNSSNLYKNANINAIFGQ
jgi:hypothetical protein